MCKLAEADRESGSEAAVVEADRLEEGEDVLGGLQRLHVLLPTALQDNLPQLEPSFRQIRTRSKQGKSLLHPLVLQGDEVGVVDQQADHPLGAHPVGEQDAEGELMQGALHTKVGEENSLNRDL